MLKYLLLSIICCGFLIILVHNTVYAVFSLILVFLQVCGVLIFFHFSEFISVLLLLVYIGAVSILFLFVVMMVDTNYYIYLQEINKENQRLSKEYKNTSLFLDFIYVAIFAAVFKSFSYVYHKILYFEGYFGLGEFVNVENKCYPYPVYYFIGYIDEFGTEDSFFGSVGFDSFYSYFENSLNDVNVIGELLYQDWNSMFYLITVLLTVTLLGAIFLCLNFYELNSKNK